MSGSEAVSIARKAFKSGKTLPVEWRIKQLKAMQRMVEENEAHLCRALFDDLRKNKTEAKMMECDHILNEVRGCLRDIRQWMKPRPKRKQLANALDGVMVKPDPYGVVLIIGAWNYPVNLLLNPVCGAIAAGNCVIMKPSELAPATATIMEELVPKYFDSDCIKVVNGGVPETTELLKERFDYILYTGSTAVGRIIHAAATKHLTPVTLELGGKCPVYVAPDADLNVTAKRILWGKVMNAGQTCIAPDYILCTENQRDTLISNMVPLLKEWLGDRPQDSKDFGRIVNERHFDRVMNLLNTTSGTIAHGGTHDKSDLYIPITMLSDVEPADPVMQEEIFGPILPFVTVESPDEAVEFINDREKPLGLYVFTEDKKTQELFMERTSSGGMVLNDVMMHIAVDTLPFGGVGASGMGAYHGEHSFETFSHLKAIYSRDLGWLGEAASSVRYPPFDGTNKGKYMSFLMQNRRPIPASSFGMIMYVATFVGTFALGAATSAFGVIGAIKARIGA